MNEQEKAVQREKELSTLCAGVAFLIAYAVSDWWLQGKYVSDAIDRINPVIAEKLTDVISLDPLRYQASTCFGTAFFAMAYYLVFTQLSGGRFSEKWRYFTVAAATTSGMIAKEVEDMKIAKASFIDVPDLIAIGAGIAMFCYGEIIGKHICNLYGKKPEPAIENPDSEKVIEKVNHLS